jgi:hypothetical protein
MGIIYKLCLKIKEVLNHDEITDNHLSQVTVELKYDQLLDYLTKHEVRSIHCNIGMLTIDHRYKGKFKKN